MTARALLEGTEAGYKSLSEGETSLLRGPALRPKALSCGIHPSEYISNIDYIVLSELKVLFYVDTLFVEVHSQVLKRLLRFDFANESDRRVNNKQLRLVLFQLESASPEIFAPAVHEQCLVIFVCG